MSVKLDKNPDEYEKVLFMCLVLFIKFIVNWLLHANYA